MIKRKDKMNEKHLFISNIYKDKERNISKIVNSLKNNEINLHSLNKVRKEEVYLFIKNQVLNKRIILTTLKHKVLCKKAMCLAEKNRGKNERNIICDRK